MGKLPVRSLPFRTEAEWNEVVRRARTGHAHRLEELYPFISSRVHAHLARYLPSVELEEETDDVFMRVVNALQRDELGSQQVFLDYVFKRVHIVVRNLLRDRGNMVGKKGSDLIDPNLSPEGQFSFKERRRLIQAVLSELSERDREILNRFYLEGQTQGEICSSMSLSETQFRLLKSRAKARFGELGKKMLVRENRDLPQRRSRVPVVHINEGWSSLVPVIARAVGVFGDEHKATHWLSTPLPILDDRSRAEVLQTKDGIARVDRILIRIEHNIPS